MQKTFFSHSLYTQTLHTQHTHTKTHMTYISIHTNITWRVYTHITHKHIQKYQYRVHTCHIKITHHCTLHIKHTDITHIYIYTNTTQRVQTHITHISTPHTPQYNPHRFTYDIHTHTCHITHNTYTHVYHTHITHKSDVHMCTIHTHHVHLFHPHFPCSYLSAYIIILYT